MSLPHAVSSSLSFHFPAHPKAQAAQADQRCSAVALSAVQQATIHGPDTRSKRKLEATTNPDQQQAYAALINSKLPLGARPAVKKFISENTQLLEELKSAPRFEKFHMTANLTAFLLAAQIGRADIVHHLIDNSLIIVSHIEEALLLALEHNHADVIRKLFFYGNIREECFSEAVRLAATHGYLEVLKALLSDGRRLRILDLNLAFYNACDNNHFDAVVFLSTKARLHSIQVVAALRTTVRQGFCNIVEYLFTVAAHSISDSAVGHAIVIATQENRSNVLAVLLKQNRSFLKRHIGDAVCSAAVHNHPHLIRALLNNDRTITLADLAFSVYKAAESGYVEVLTALLESKKTLKNWEIENAIREALKRGHLKAVKYLFSHMTVLRSATLASFIAEATQYNHSEIVAFVIDKAGIINFRYLIGATHNVIRNNNLHLLKLLMASSFGLQTYMLNLFVLAASIKGFFPIVEFLLLKGRITRDVQYSAIANASGEAREQICYALQRALIEDHHISYRNMFYVNPSVLKQHPVRFLAPLLHLGLDTSIAFTNADGLVARGTDIGGLKKQFLSWLCEHMIAREAFCVNDRNLPMASQPMQEETCCHLATLISRIHRANADKTDKLLTGRLFDGSFLEMVRVFINEHVPENRFLQVCKIVGRHDPKFSQAAQFVLDPNNITKFAYLTSFGLTPSKEEAKVVTDDPILAEARECFAPFYAAARGFTSGTTDFFKRAILATDPQELCHSFQGEVLTPHGVLASLKIHSNPDTEALLQIPLVVFSEKSSHILSVFATGDNVAIERLQQEIRQERATGNPTSALCTQKIEWLIEEIALKSLSREEDVSWLRNFVFSVTGKTTMLLGTKIKLGSSSRPDMFEMHTCFNSLDMPATEMSRDCFLGLLEGVISGGKDADYNTE
ncbi:MAG: hypothetical protein JSS62_04015 [Verrucomicrobia bacterium]|nr:hypothetical protein [Verrucomicrobiota bacterium]MBS0647063.1 hypothetical protein [Verrucomicrobiota bacterium]